MKRGMTMNEMIDYYGVIALPITKCPIFRTLHGVLCGNCALLEVCEHGKGNIERNRKLRSKSK